MNNRSSRKKYTYVEFDKLSTLQGQREKFLHTVKPNIKLQTKKYISGKFFGKSKKKMGNKKLLYP